MPALLPMLRMVPENGMHRDFPDYSMPMSLTRIFPKMMHRNRAANSNLWKVFLIRPNLYIGKCMFMIIPMRRECISIGMISCREFRCAGDAPGLRQYRNDFLLGIPMRRQYAGNAPSSEYRVLRPPILTQHPGEPRSSLPRCGSLRPCSQRKRISSRRRYDPYRALSLLLRSLRRPGSR